MIILNEDIDIKRKSHEEKEISILYLGRESLA